MTLYKPLISVVIPVYNCEAYLSRCLDSVCGQTYSRLEIICVNDGSTDDSGDILNKRAEIDSRFKIIHQKNGGVSVARNVALSCATGEFITMIDADDYVDLNIIEKMISAVENSSVDMVLCGLKYIGKEGKSVNSMPKMLPGVNISVASDFFEHFNPGPVAKLYKTEIIRKYDISFPVGVVVGEDAAFVALYWHYISKVFVLKEALYVYDNRNCLSSTSKFKSGYQSFSVYVQTVALPCTIFDTLKKRRDGVKPLSEWLPCLLKMQLVENGWVMDSVISTASVRDELKTVSRNCYKQLAQYLTLYSRIRVNVLYRVSWLKGRMMRIAGKVKRFLFTLFLYKKH